MTNINDKEVAIYVIGGFSDRKSIKKFSEVVQTNSLDKRTRNKLYNQVHQLLTNEDNNFKANIVKYIYTLFLFIIISMKKYYYQNFGINLICI